MEEKGLLVIEEQTFEHNAKHLLEMIGYAVEFDGLVGGGHSNLLARKQEGPFERLLLVHCAEDVNPLGPDRVRAFHDRLRAVQNTHPAIQGAMISNRGFTRDARGLAWRLGLYLLSLEELSRTLLDLSPYRQALIQAAANETEARGPYIEPVAVENLTGRQAPAGELVDQWLEDTSPTFRGTAPEYRGANYLVVLGEHGTGKTWFTVRLAGELARRHETDPLAYPMPFRLNLRDLGHIADVEALIAHYLVKYKVSHFTYDAFRHLVEEGHIILLLDGFDEIGPLMTAEQAGQYFNMLTGLIAGKPKARMLITSRPHLFRDLPEIVPEIAGVSPSPRDAGLPGTPLYHAIARQEAYRLIFLQDFSEDQVSEYLRRASADEWPIDYLTIESIYDLRHLARRPILLGMIARSLTQLAVPDAENPEERPEGKEGATQVQTAASLYQTYTNLWLSRDDWRSPLPPAERSRFVQDLAWKLWTEDRRTVYRGEFAPLFWSFHSPTDASLERGADAAGGQKIGAPSEYSRTGPLAYEVRTASFLRLEPEEGLGFSHRSFEEYFVAQRLAEELQRGEGQGLRARLITPEVFEFLRTMDLKPDLLWQLLHQTRGQTFEVTRYQGANAAMLLNLLGEDLSGRDLSGAILAYANLSNVDLTGTCLSRADLRYAHLANARLRDVDLTGADLAGLRLAEASGLRCMHVDAEGRIIATGGNTGLIHLWAAPPTIGGAPQTDTGVAGQSQVEGRALGVLSGQTDDVLCLAFRPDGRQIAAGGRDHTLRLWDVRSRREMVTLKGHTGEVAALAYSADGTRLASASARPQGGGIKLWDLRRSAELRTIDHPHGVFGLAFSPDGLRLASGGDDGQTTIWHPATGRVVARLKDDDWVTRMAFNPAGDLLAVPGFGGTIRLWETATWRLVRTLRGHTGQVWEVAFSRDGANLISAGEDMTIRRWDINVPSPMATWKGHDGPVMSVAFSAGDVQVYSAGWDGTMRVWDGDTGQCLHVLQSRMDYQGLKLSGSRGLPDADQEYLRQRGASW
ncbi:MAG: NACHT domain-containing protein [Chloroflexi bacterium]|nr:NACHT domain-containing protein [Chloroflexota bacterium]